MSVSISPFSRTTQPMFNTFVPVTYSCGSVLIWRRSDALCTSDFMYDVMFAQWPGDAIKVYTRSNSTGTAWIRHHKYSAMGVLCLRLTESLRTIFKSLVMALKVKCLALAPITASNTQTNPPGGSIKTGRSLISKISLCRILFKTTG